MERFTAISLLFPNPPCRCLSCRMEAEMILLARWVSSTVHKPEWLGEDSALGRAMFAKSIWG